MTIKPKQLRKVTTGQIFTYTKALAGRKDMVPHWPDGVDPNAPRAAGLSVEASQVGQLHQILEEKNAIIQELEEESRKKDAEIAALKDQLQKAIAQVNALTAELNGTHQPPEVVPGPESETTETQIVDPDLSLSRQGLINEAVKAMYEEGNEDDFTKGHLPRIENVEARCGIAEVTAAERDAAVEAYNQNKEQ